MTDPKNSADQTHDEGITPDLPPAPSANQKRGEDALDHALQESMIASDPPSTLPAPEYDEDEE